MRIGVIDTAATTGDSALHCARPAAKLLAFVLVLAAVVTSTNVLVVLAIGLSLAAVIVALRLPWRAMLALAAYPGIFAVLFAVAAAPGWLQASLIVAKAIAAALTAVLLVFTTPYPQIFAPIQRLVPGVLGDALLMTYRSLFLLLDTFDHTLIAVRLRSGLSRREPLRAARAVTSTLGVVSLYSLDLSQRTYDIMRLRGYDGRLVVSERLGGAVARDVGVIAFGVVAFLIALTVRVAWRHLNAYSWILPVAAIFALSVALLVTALSGSKETP